MAQLDDWMEPLNGALEFTLWKFVKFMKFVKFKGKSNCGPRVPYISPPGDLPKQFNLGGSVTISYKGTRGDGFKSKKKKHVL